MNCIKAPHKAYGIDVNNILYHAAVSQASVSYIASQDCIAVVEAIYKDGVSCSVYIDDVYMGRWQSYASAITSPSVSVATFPLVCGSKITVKASGVDVSPSNIYVYGLKS